MTDHTCGSGPRHFFLAGKCFIQIRAIRIVIRIRNPDRDPDHSQNVMDRSLARDTCMGIVHYFLTNPAYGQT